MNSKSLKALLRTAALAGAGALTAAGPSLAAPVEVYLKAQSLPGALPGGVTVPMWRFICDPAAPSNANCSASAPEAPARIDASAGDTLTIHLANGLLTPVSVLIPGQAGGGVGTPVPDPATGRVRSFGPEVAAGGTGDYSFTSLRAGTYLYQSGTLPSIQVPMGLSGALVVTGAGYPAGDVEALVVYSEVDPVQNAAVEAAVAANPASPAYPSTVSYSPQYFLVNGAPYDASTPPPALVVGDGSVARSLLLRLANAGLRSHAANIVGLEMTVGAEDGNVYPSPKVHSSTLLPAGKTLDATVALPAGNRTYPIYDRMLDLTNANQPGGGLLAYLQTGSGSPTTPPTAVAVNDTYNDVVEDTPYIVAAPGVLGNDASLSGATVVTSPANGTLALNPDGSFTYTPNPDYSGPDSFVYSASDGTNSYSAQVTLAVSFVNDPPVGAADAYANTVGTTISAAAPGVLGNDVDADGDPLTAQLVTGLPGLTLNADGSFTYAGAAGNQSFTYNVSDGTTTGGPVTVTLTRNAPNGATLTVLGPASEPVTEYRWVLEQDLGFHPDPTLNQQQQLQRSLGTNFHRSYMPVVAQGCVTATPGPGNWCTTSTPLTQSVVDRNSHYFVSVLPATAGTETGYTLGAAPIPPRVQGQPYAVTVRVNKAPVPTAQIHVWVFEDNAPVNGTPDGEEPGLGGFQLLLEDGGGRYGISAGAMMFDAFGEPVRNSLDCFGGAPPADIILTCPDTPANQAAGLVGRALIKNLAPAKYGVQAVPPAGSTVKWSQTSTIEGKKVIDAWVKAGEPAFFQEFGPPGYHVFIGFVSPERVGTPSGAHTVSGRVTNLHMSRPPDQTLYDSDSRDALAHTTAWVGLNSAGGLGPAIAVAKADAESNGFSLGGVPDGSYQLVVWDDYLDQIIAFRNVTVSGGSVDLGNIPVFQWFARLEHHVFHDANENGLRDAGEEGMPEQNVNLRFRDGSVYQAAPTDGSGFVPFDETFPFFHWLVAEVDFARHKATGVTVTVDGGGDVTATGGVLKPQVQLPADGGGTSRTETGPVLLQAFQGFIGQTSVLEWGKKPYAPGENGGISGIVYYSITRAEDDPRLGVGDPWEPGIPDVTVRLYREVTRQDGSKGLVFVAETVSDSFDRSQPTGCPGAHPSDPVNPPTRCYDGLRNFNQVRPGVFDGGYAFSDIPPGRYVVEMIPPPGYEVVKEEDKNVVFGDVLTPALMLPGGTSVAILPDQRTAFATSGPEPGLIQPECVGPAHTVPPFLSLLPDIMEPAPFAGESRPLCNRKLVILNDRSNGVADFHLFTAAPIAGHGVGMILDDTAQEFNPNSPQFGEKWAPPFVPISFRDWTGREISRVLSDQWGRFNALVPSTYNANAPMFSGMSPSMMISCMNDPGPIPGPGGTPITDPQYNPVYGTFCYTLQYMPGTTTYLDTPVIPTAAFAAGYPGVDCAYPNGTPMVRQVNGTGVGPWVSGAGQTLTILAQGLTDVPNPAYLGPEGPPGQVQPKTIQRDYGFGTNPGTVTIGGVPLTNVVWGASQITGTVPAVPSPGSYQLAVTRSNGRSTMNSVTVHVGGPTPVHVTTPGAADLPIGPIQAAIDAATAGQLILVDPGTYPELVIMTKPVRLQGAGPGVTFINAAKVPTQKLDNWRTKINTELGETFGSGNVDLLPPQELGAAGVEPDTLNTEQGAGITVLGRSDARCATPDVHCFSGIDARIDGFTLTAGDSAGAIYVNGWAHGLQISNNIVKGNSGLFHGGVRVGVPYLQGLDAIDPDGPYGFNRDLRVHHNQITHNGGLGGAGGGLMLCTGTDGYRVTENWICGNFTQGHGAGIAHFGLSNDGLIARNQILFNQSFNQGLNVHGGGLLIAGDADAAGALGLGAGNVTVDANLILGNQAGAGHGGGIRTQFVNGVDANVGGTPTYRIAITNNMIANNVTGWAGGGISLQDTVDAQIVNNTVARNDSTATVGAAFTAGPNTSAFQPAGIVSEPHSPALGAVPGVGTFSNPTAFRNNILWENRSFYYSVNAQGVGSLLPALTPSATGACDGGTPNYWDLGVLGGGTLTPTSSILTGGANPSFLASYCNTARTMRRVPGVTTIQAVPALDEGGNWIEVRYGPITLTRGNDLNFFGNYHISGTSPAINAGTAPAPAADYDGQTRTAPPDIGADEKVMPTLLSIVPASSTAAQRGTNVNVTLTGTNLTGATAVNVSGNGVTVNSFTVVNGTTITASFAISNGGGNTGAKNVTVTTPDGTSNPVTFTKN